MGKTKHPEVVRSEEDSFCEIALLIEAAREKTLRAVNTALIDLYWHIGQTLSRRIESAEWGEGVVDRLAEYLARTQPGLRGFTRANLFRMRQFFETYRAEEKVAPLVRQLPWTAQPAHHGAEQAARRTGVLSPSRCQRELEQARARTADESGTVWTNRVVAGKSLSPPVRQMGAEAISAFKDSYVLDFLGLGARSQYLTSATPRRERTARSAQ
jgi:predicted nuclease of restriction endonuclease-like (RecB) superfamily